MFLQHPYRSEHVFPPDYETRVQDGVAPLDGIRDFAAHSQRRKLWNKSVAPAAVKEYGEMLKGVIAELMEELEKRQGEDVDLSAWMGYAA